MSAQSELARVKPQGAYRVHRSPGASLAFIVRTAFEEIERLNIPVVQICTIIPVAKEVGSLRAMASGAIVSPTGNPGYRRRRKKSFGANSCSPLYKFCRRTSASKPHATRAPSGRRRSHIPCLVRYRRGFGPGQSRGIRPWAGSKAVC